MSRQELIEAFSFEGVNRSNAVVNFKEDDPIDPKALWLNSQHQRTMPPNDLVPYVCKELEQAGLTPLYGGDWLLHTVDVLRSRFFTLKDFVARGRAYFSDDFRIEPDALEKLDKPGARELLRELAGRVAASPEFTEQSVEAELRKLAEERSVKAGLLINAARAALTGESVGPSAFAVFIAIGRDRVIERLRRV